MTNPNLRTLAILLALSALGGARSASADLVLSFDQSSYSTGVGGTSTVNVYVSQVSGGPQVGVGNELLSGDIALSFATTGPAQVLSTSDVTFGSAWDLGLATSSTSGPDTVLNVSLLSILGISDLSSPLLLASFEFTGLDVGSTTISVSQFDPSSADFITAMGNVVDPTNVPTAVIGVTSGAAVPLPASAVLLASGLLFAGPAFRRRASRNSTSPREGL